MDEHVRALERREQTGDSPLATAIALARGGRSYAEIVLDHPERVPALAQGYRNKTAEAVAVVVDTQLDRWMQLALEQTQAIRARLQENNNARRSSAVDKEKDIERLVHLNARLARYASAEAYLAQIHPRRNSRAKHFLAREAANNNDFSRADNYALTLIHTTQTLAKLKASMAGRAARHGDEERALRYASEAGNKHKCSAFQSIARGFAYAREYDRAVEYLQNSTRYPDLSFYGELALIAESNKDTAHADELFSLARKCDGQKIAREAARRQDYERAERLAPNLECLAETAAENGDYDRATRYHLADKIATNVARREAYVMIISAAAKRGDRAKFEEFRALPAETRSYVAEWAFGHLRNGAVAETEKCMADFAQTSTDSIAYYYQIERWTQLMEIVGGR